MGNLDSGKLAELAELEAPPASLCRGRALVCRLCTLDETAVSGDSGGDGGGGGETWRMLKDGFALPEYVVDYDYVVDGEETTPRQPVASTGATHKAVQGLLAMVPQLPRRHWSGDSLDLPLFFGEQPYRLITQLNVSRLGIRRIPALADAMPELRQVYASCNQLSSTSWASNLAHLEALDVSFNAVLSVKCKHLPALLSLNVSENLLDSLPALCALGRDTPALTELDTRGNRLAGAGGGKGVGCLKAAFPSLTRYNGDGQFPPPSSTVNPAQILASGANVPRVESMWPVSFFVAGHPDIKMNGLACTPCL